MTSKNGLWLDGQRQAGFSLVPGAEIAMGRVRLIVQSPRLKRARALLARWIGWNAVRRVAVEDGLQAIREYIAARAPLVLSGQSEDLVALARHLHREAIGSSRPFVVCNAKRTTAATEITRAYQHAARGTLCIHADRLPDDLATALAHAREPENRTRLILCSRAIDSSGTVDGGHLRIPALLTRREDLDRLVVEYALDAIVQLGAKSSSFTAVDHEVAASGEPSSLFEIATATLRLVAIREYGGVTRAAPHLGVSHGALSRWVARRVRRRGTK